MSTATSRGHEGAIDSDNSTVTDKLRTPETCTQVCVQAAAHASEARVMVMLQVAWQNK